MKPDSECRVIEGWGQGAEVAPRGISSSVAADSQDRAQVIARGSKPRFWSL